MASSVQSMNWIDSLGGRCLLLTLQPSLPLLQLSLEQMLRLLLDVDDLESL